MQQEIKGTQTFFWHLPGGDSTVPRLARAVVERIPYHVNKEVTDASISFLKVKSVKSIV